MCPHLCAICFHDTGHFSAPPLIRLSSGSQSLGGISAPVPPRACLLASMRLWKGSWPAGGGGRWAVGAPFLFQRAGNRTQGGGDATWSISHDISMLVPRTARTEASRTQAPSINEDKVDGPAAKAQKRQDGCSQAWGHTEPSSVQKRCMSLGLGEMRLRTAALLTRLTVRLMPASVHRGSRCQRGAASGASPSGTRTVSSHSSPCLSTWGQRETEGLHPGPRAGAAAPAMHVGLPAAVSGGAAPSPSVRFKQTKPSCVVGWHEVCPETTEKHRDVTDLRASDSDSRACPVDRRLLVRKEGGRPGGDPGGQGRGLSAGRRSPDTAASTRLEHLSDTKCYNPQSARERLPTQRVRVTSVASTPKL